MWHKVTLTFDGPLTSETANPNPFTQYRLNVTFTQDGPAYLVPGYFAADGNAADSGDSRGNKWRVHFPPPSTGIWNYAVSFRTGKTSMPKPPQRPGSALATWIMKRGPCPSGLGNHALRSERWRYIRYHDGSEELYDHANDPHEWTNLADRPDLQPVIAELARWLPAENAPPVSGVNESSFYEREAELRRKLSQP